MPPDQQLTGPVQVVGVGLLGTSVALACRRAGLEVLLTDITDDHVRTASGLGAGRARRPGDRPQLVVVAVPPDHLGEAIAAALADPEAPGAVVTDVGSIKSAPLATVQAGDGVERYVGGHPMAGSERSGPLSASETLFDGRPWAVTPHPAARPEAVALVHELVAVCGAVGVVLTPAEHDRAVARTSHVPHLLAAVMAGRLTDAPADHLALSGQGLRDVTRIAAGDPGLYGQIVSGNAAAVAALLGEVRTELDRLITAVASGDRPGLEALLAAGADGTRAIPGKHGGPVRAMGSVWVTVPDTSGELARLFVDAGASEVNIEDVRIDHDPGRPVGLVELVVDAEQAESLRGLLADRGWATHR